MHTNRVKWLQATALVQLLQQAKRDLDLMGVMSELDKYRVLIIDDIGPDTLMTVAAIDRIIHHATIIEIDAESYRKKHHKKAK